MRAVDVQRKGNAMKEDQANYGKQLRLRLRNVNLRIKRLIGNSETKKQFDNVTGMHGYVIGFLKNNLDRDIFQRDVEKTFSIRRSTATTILQGMEKNGLIVRHPTEYDTRLKKIILTEKAKQMCETFESDCAVIDSVILKGFTEAEAKKMDEFLNRIAENLNELDDTCGSNGKIQ